MGKTTILDQLGEQAISPDELAGETIRKPGLLPELLEGLSSTNPRIKYGCAKALRSVSAESPTTLYHEFDFFANLLDSENKILRWNAMDILGNLTVVDARGRFDELFENYFSLLGDKVMITAAHVVDNSGTIATAKPHLAQRITGELLNLERIPRNQECTNILAGKAILAFGRYFDQIEDKEKVLSFVKRQLGSTRNATRKKAEQFLRKFEKSGQ